MSNCCRCQPVGVTKPCKTAMTVAEIGELVWVGGLDENLCCKFQAVCDLLQLRDCDGNPIDCDQEIVTCEAFQQILCDTLAALTPAGDLTLDVTQVVGADCQLYTVPETLLTVVDTACINLTASGAYNHTLQADLVISSDPDNVAVCSEDGLFVPSICEQFDGLASSGPLTLASTEIVGADCTLYTVPETPITVVDTPCIDLAVSGAFSHTLTATLNIDPAVDNVAECRAGGLFVPSICTQFDDLSFSGDAIPGVTRLVGADCETYSVPTADVTIVGTDTPCFDISVVEAPANTFTISGAPIVSPNAGNALSCAGNGLYVATAAAVDVSIVGIDSACFDIEVTEGPANTFTIQGDVVVSPNAGNILDCVGNGLYVPDFNVTALDTDCINLSVTESPANTFIVSAAPIIANAKDLYPAGCNGLVCQDDGLAAPPDIAGNTGIDTTPPGGFFVPFLAMNPLDVVQSDTAHIDIVNPSDCRSAILVITVRIPSLNTANDNSEAGNYLELQVWHERNLPGFIVDGAPVKYTEFKLNNNNIGAGSPPAERSFVFVVPPGFVGWYETYAILEQTAGSTVSVSAGSVGAHYVLHTI